MASDAKFKILNGIHRFVLKSSGGRIGWSASGMQVVKLTTVGRRSGELRLTMLTSPLQEGTTLVVVASRGGDDRHPDWYLNLQKTPEVVVTIEGKSAMKMIAQTANSEERSRLWAMLTARQPRYAGYQRKASREIPVVLLQPVEI